MKKKSISKRPFIVAAVTGLILMLPAAGLAFLPRRSPGVVIAVLITQLAVIAIGYSILYRTLRKAGLSLRNGMETRTSTPEQSAMVLRRLLCCSRLAVLTSIYTDVVALKKSRIWGITRSYGIYRYTGQIDAGISRLEDCTFAIDQDRNSITVVLPEVTVVNHTLKSIEKFDEKNSVFCPISNTEIFEEIRRRQHESEQKLLECGLLHEAETRAQEVVTQLLAAMGYTGYDIHFTHDPAAAKTVTRLKSESIETTDSDRSTLFHQKPQYTAENKTPDPVTR